MADSTNANNAPAAPEAAAAPAPAEKKLTPKELRKLEREAKKRAELEAKAKAEAEIAAANAHIFGDYPLIQSQTITDRTWTRVEDLNASLEGQEVLVRARVHNVRATGKMSFVTLRQATATVQAVVFKGDNAHLQKFINGIPKESVVDITGKVTVPEAPVTSTTQGDVELQIVKAFTVSKANALLPFQLEDASRPDSVYEEIEEEEKKALAEGREYTGKKYPHVSQDTRLDYRWIDLRTPANQAIMRISSGVCTFFREFLLKKNFVEIQTPKLLGGASEGGAAVFELKYFGEDACLAQSPQLYKQMAAACSDLERVFEIGPVFRAENSNTHRHLCEFHGLDLEMAINEHYYEVLDLFSELFIYIFDSLNKYFKRELEAVRAQHPFEDLQYLTPTLRLTYQEGIAMLKEAGAEIEDGDDLNTAQERLLGKLVKEKYKTDFFMMDKYPMEVRPFYTMPDPENPKYSNSYDFFLRGEEIVSGAQRVHDPELLTKIAIEKEIEVSTIQSYIDSFKHGALPHGGGGVGLERVVMLFLGLPNIRKTSMFPRDPRRLHP